MYALPHACFALSSHCLALRRFRATRCSSYSSVIRCAHPSFRHCSVPTPHDGSAGPSLSGTLGAVDAGGGGDVRGAGGSWGGSGGERTPDEGASDGFGELRPEVAAALRAGRVSSDEVRRLLALEAGPLGPLCALFPALRDRLVSNPLFFTQLFVELIVGVVSKLTAEVAARAEAFYEEMALVVSDVALEIVTDACLVWLLSPKLQLTAPSGNWLSGCPSHISQIGNFSTAQRLTTFAFKGAQFALVGFVSAVIGHSITRALVAQRERRRKERGDTVQEDVSLGPVLPTALAWGGFLLCSSNARYQIVNGIEQRFIDPMLGGSAVMRTAVTFGLRFSNCLVGGVQWIPWAKFWGVQ